jgi:RimJ/RimL family protein N-acetyltransferase
MQMFSTQRLRVRTWTASDHETLASLLGDARTMRHWPEPLDREAVLAWLQRSEDGMQQHGCGRWCVELLATDECIGDVGIMRMTLQGEPVFDLGYIIHADHWYHGYGLEAARGAVEWARSQSLEKLVATMATDNAPSVGVAEKLGFRRVREFVNQRNRNKATYWYELILD